MKVRIRDRRDLFTSVRAAILRADFFAEAVLAIVVLFIRQAYGAGLRGLPEMK
jgi:hypothetical protein